MRRLPPILVFAAVFIMAGSRAWICDDAFITFRVVEQFLAGHGPVFNIGERVQVFTHPLWMMALAAWAGLGATLFPGVMWLSLAVFGVGLAAIFAAFRERALALCIVGALMFFSRTLMDYASGGLETPLSFALFAGALYALRSAKPRMAIALLALLPLNRLDLLPWALPFAWIAAERGFAARARTLAAVCVPAALWAAFSTIYYGDPLPNTALAKLGGDWTARLDQGLSYVVASLATDPGSFALFIAGIAIAARSLRGAERTRDTQIVAAGALSAGVAFAYVLWSGGDFMLGRFMLPLLWGLIAVVLAGFPHFAQIEPGVSADRRAGALVLALLAALHLVSGQSSTNLWLHLAPDSPLRAVSFAGAIDERRYYLPEPFVVLAAPASTGRPLVAATLGRSGYNARRDQPMIDIWALADPFLARFAPLPNGRPGHAYRPFPPEFHRWRESDHSFGDGRLDALASDLRLAHRSPDLWSGERAKAIARLALQPAIPMRDLSVEREAGEVRITVRPAWLFRLWPHAQRYVVWLRLQDPSQVVFSEHLPIALDRGCEKVPVDPARDRVTGIEVGAGETLTLHCPSAGLAGHALLMRIGAPRVVGGRERVEFDEEIQLMRPALWWLSRAPDWIVRGWSERPGAAQRVAIFLLFAAALLWRSGRYTLSTSRIE